MHACSYMYEYNAAKATWDWAKYLGVSSVPDLDGNPDTSWQEVKAYQLAHGDTFHPGAYDETVFPVVRCFHHWRERSIRVNDPIDGPRSEGITITVAHAGNVYVGPWTWELTPEE